MTTDSKITFSTTPYGEFNFSDPKRISLDNLNEITKAIPGIAIDIEAETGTIYVSEIELEARAISRTSNSGKFELHSRL